MLLPAPVLSTQHFSPMPSLSTQHSALSTAYTILWHDGVREPHFDLMFETFPGSPLATWRVPLWPVESPTAATRLKDHRREYLEYEGELTERRGRRHPRDGGDV